MVPQGFSIIPDIYIYPTFNLLVNNIKKIKYTYSYYYCKPCLFIIA